MIDLGITAEDPMLRSGQCQYQRTTAWWCVGFGRLEARYDYLAEHVLEQWIPFDRSGEWLLERRTTGRRRWLRGNARDASRNGFDLLERWPVGQWSGRGGDFHGDDGQHDSRRGSWQEPTDDFLGTISRNPYELYGALDAASPPNATGYNGVVTYALDVLRSGRVPADLRSSLYAALTLVPGMRMEERAEGPERQPCAVVVLRFSDGLRLTEMLVDRVRGLFLGERCTLAARSPSGLDKGTVVKSTSVDHAVVDTIGARPERNSRRSVGPGSFEPGPTDRST